MRRIVKTLGKWTPLLLGLVFLYSGGYKLIFPGEATLALKVLDFGLKPAKAMIIAITVLELYLGTILVLKVDLKLCLRLATGLIFGFTAFLWYLSMLAHPPACGCMGLTHLFLSNRQNAMLGLVRNCGILWLLKWAYDYYVKAPQTGEARLG